MFVFNDVSVVSEVLASVPTVGVPVLSKVEVPEMSEGTSTPVFVLRDVVFVVSVKRGVLITGISVCELPPVEVSVLAEIESVTATTVGFASEVTTVVVATEVFELVKLAITEGWS